MSYEAFQPADILGLRYRYFCSTRFAPYEAACNYNFVIMVFVVFDLRGFALSSSCMTVELS